MKRKIDVAMLNKTYDKKQIRTSWDSARREMYFCIPDIIFALTLTKDPADYLKKLRKRTPELAADWSTIIVPHEIETNGGRQFPNCANAENVFRIIQAMPKNRKVPIADHAETAGIETPRVKKDVRAYSMTEVYLIALRAAKKAKQ